GKGRAPRPLRRGRRRGAHPPRGDPLHQVRKVSVLRRRRRTPPPLPRPRGRVEPLAKQAVGWGQAPWRSWSVLCVPPSRPPPASGGGRGWRVAGAPPPPARGRGGGMRGGGGGPPAGKRCCLGGVGKARRICGRGCPVAPPPACGGRLGGGPANGRRPTIPR